MAAREWDRRADVKAIAAVEGIDVILRILTEATNLRTALVARVTDTTWTLCAILDRQGFGLKPGDELEVAQTYCNTVGNSCAPLLIRHASEDPRFCNHPGLTRFGVESYIAVPLKRRNGEFFGTLCAFDTRPMTISERKIPLFQALADLISLQLEAGETAKWREVFLAILSHDLRNPLGAIAMTASVLSRDPPAEPPAVSAQRILAATERIERMIDQLLDLTRGRLAGGIPIQPRPTCARELLRRSVSELQARFPGRTIRADGPESVPAHWDPDRCLQLLGNLIGNALVHSPDGSPVDIELSASADGVTIEIHNQGAIPAEVQADLFQPFRRPSPSHDGLGLGLYIAKLITSAHGGHIAARSSDDRTTFTVQLPRSAA